MSKRLNSQAIQKWTLDKLEEDKLYYGSDIGNPAIMLAYLQEMKPNTKVEDLTIADLSGCASTSRIKNKILEVRPDLDCREVYAIDRSHLKWQTLPFPLFWDK